jgi:hypothetical protein
VNPLDYACPKCGAPVGSDCTTIQWRQIRTGREQGDYARGPHRERTERAVHERLEALRVEIRAERISYGEIAELQGLAEYIPAHDTELLEWAGVPEHDA